MMLSPRSALAGLFVLALLTGCKSGYAGEQSTRPTEGGTLPVLKTAGGSWNPLSFVWKLSSRS